MVQEPWIHDFSYSRNRALTLAREKFPKSIFLLMPDAEWFIKNVPGLLDFCKQKIDDVKNSNYLMRVVRDAEDFPTPRLIRTHGIGKFHGAIHEVPLPPAVESVPSDVYFELGYTKQGLEKSLKRWRDRDLPILHRAIEKNPFDSRNMFYLARTYDSLNDVENAYKYYERRAKLNHYGWDEENFWNAYSLAMTAEKLSETKPEITWPMVLDLYLKAHALRPSRAEPLVRIGEHYWKKGEKALAFFFARRAVELRYPQNERLFMDKSIYNYQRYELVSKSAAWVDECAIGERATKILLEIEPKVPQWHKNYAIYLECDKKPSDLWGYSLDEDDDAEEDEDENDSEAN